jgi:hypothetical protein
MADPMQEDSDSLKGSFRETELSSDDERAEQQVEEARRRQKQQTELQEFERQIKARYVRYQEPVEVLDQELISQIAFYPRDYLLRALAAKEMNYATATYYLLSKKRLSKAHVI